MALFSFLERPFRAIHKAVQDVTQAAIGGGILGTAVGAGVAVATGGLFAPAMLIGAGVGTAAQLGLDLVAGGPPGGRAAPTHPPETPGARVRTLSEMQAEAAGAVVNFREDANRRKAALHREQQFKSFGIPDPESLEEFKVKGREKLGVTTL